MKEAFQTYLELVSIDATYKLLELRLLTDSNSQNKIIIVAVGLLAIYSYIRCKQHDMDGRLTHLRNTMLNGKESMS